MLVNKLTKANLSYIAGFVDGEGFIGYVRGRLMFKISNTNYPILDWIQRITGSGNITELKGITQLRKRRPAYQWSCYGNTARELIKVLKPFLKIKAGQGFLI